MRGGDASCAYLEERAERLRGSPASSCRLLRRLLGLHQHLACHLGHTPRLDMSHGRRLGGVQNHDLSVTRHPCQHSQIRAKHNRAACRAPSEQVQLQTMFASRPCKPHLSWLLCLRRLWERLSLRPSLARFLRALRSARSSSMGTAAFCSTAGPLRRLYCLSLRSPAAQQAPH